MKKKLKLPFFFSIILLFAMGPQMQVYAYEGEDVENDFTYIEDWLSENDFSSVNKGLNKLFPGIKVDARQLLTMVLNGNVLDAFQTLIWQIKDGLWGELSGLRQVFIYMLVLGVVSALFAEFSDLFAGREIAQAGFYFLYLFLIAILTRVILFVSEIAQTTIEDIVLFVKIFIPTYCIAVGTVQGTASAVYYYELMLAVAYLVESFLNRIVIPFIYSYVMLALLNGIWSEEKLSLLLDFVEKGIEMALKVSMGAVTGLSLVQAVILPVASGLKISAMRKAVSAIPGIGSVAEGITELVLGSAVLIKNSMGVLFLILLLGACLMPLLKIMIVTVTVKLGAALTGIVSDKRISSCADRVGKGCMLFWKCVFTSVFLFIIVVAVVSYAVSY